MNFLARFSMFIFYALFILTGTISQMEIYSRWSIPLMVISSAAIFLITLLLKNKSFKFYFIWFDKLYLFFILNIFLSAIVNNNSSTLNNLLVQTLYYIVLSLCVRNLPEILNAHLLFYSFLVSGLWIFFLNVISLTSLTRATISQGLFLNPNGLGMFTAGFLSTLLTGAIYMFIEKKSIGVVFFISLAIFSFYVMVLSGSRTSFMGIIMSLICLVSLYSLGIVKNRKVRFRKTKFYNSIFIGMLLIIFGYILMTSSLIDTIEDNILFKFQNRRGNITAGRTGVWKIYLDNIGYYASSYELQGNIIGLSTHSSYLNIAARFGLVTGVVYLILWIKNILYLIKYSIHNYKIDNLLPFYILSISLYIIMSLMEDLNETAIMFAALCSISLMISKTSLKYEDI